VKRISLALLIIASASCTDNAGRTTLAPSAVVATNASGQSPFLTWSQFTSAQSAPVDTAAIVGPASLAAAVSGSTVTLTWQPVAGASQYIIEAGSAPGLSNLALLLTGSTATSLTVGGVPNNVYYVRVRGLVGNLGTDQSNEVTVTVGTVVPCVSTVSPTAINVGNTATTATVNVTSACAWTAVSAVPWVTIASGPSGSGNGVVTLNIAANPGGSRQGTLTIAGQTVTVSQGSGSISVSFELFDPGAQSAATRECRIVSSSTQCDVRSTSFTAGTNTIVTYQWSVQYTYDTARSLTTTGASPTFSFSDACGLSSSTSDGVAQPLSVSLTVTDNRGETATATSGIGNQPELSIRLFTCPTP